jgi:hypothetical protein
MGNSQNATEIIAWIALGISLTGGIPGFLSTVNWFYERPKLNFLLRNMVTGDMSIDDKEYKSYLYLVLAIGNEGRATFKRLGNPKIDVMVKNKWVGLRVMPSTENMIEAIPNTKFKDIIKNFKILDYYANNPVIAVNENIDVFIHAIADASIFDYREITPATKYRITLKDVKNRTYCEIMKIE